MILSFVWSLAFQAWFGWSLEPQLHCIRHLQGKDLTVWKWDEQVVSGCRKTQLMKDRFDCLRKHQYEDVHVYLRGCSTRDRWLTCLAFPFSSAVSSQTPHFSSSDFFSVGLEVFMVEIKKDGVEEKIIIIRITKRIALAVYCLFDNRR